MSPRLQSSITGTDGGIKLKTVANAFIPASPKTSKNAIFGLKAAAYGCVASMIPLQNDTAASAVASGNYDIR